MRVFISYRRGSGIETARYLHDRLTDWGVDIFMDIEDMPPGPFPASLERAIILRDYFMIILTPDTLESEWVKREIETARRHEKPMILIGARGFDPEKHIPPTLVDLKQQQIYTYDPAAPQPLLDKLREILKPRRAINPKMVAGAVLIISLLVIIAALVSQRDKSTDADKGGNTVNITGPVENVISANVIEALTIHTGDSPEEKARKIQLQAELLASDILAYDSNIDARIHLIATYLGLEDTFGADLERQRVTLAPTFQVGYQAGYSELIAKTDLLTLREQFNEYPMPDSIPGALLQLTSESGANIESVRFFYQFAMEVDSLTKEYLESLENLAKIDPTNAAEHTYYTAIAQNTYQRLVNRALTAHVAALDVLNDIQHEGAIQSSAASRLSLFYQLTPRTLISQAEVLQRQQELLHQTEALSNEYRTLMLTDGQAMLDASLQTMEALNRSLLVQPDDTPEEVVKKARSLRDLGRVDEAIAAFAAYEAMFVQNDPDAARYATIAQAFTRQLATTPDWGVTAGAVYIFYVVPDSLAQELGLEIGDIIIALNEHPIQSVDDLQAALETLIVGESTTLETLRFQENGTFRRQTYSFEARSRMGIGYMLI